MNGVFGDLIDVAAAYLHPVQQDPANRERSWERCYSFFQGYREMPRKQQEKQRELACLHLGFYLASWGMFRGPLIHKDYTIYADVIDILLKEQYAQLWNPVFFKNLLAGNQQVTQNDTQLIFELATHIREHINGLLIVRNYPAQPEHARATNTLITKIIMGTLACVPAYDQYFCKGLPDCGIRRCGSFTLNCFTRLLNICREHNLWQMLQRQPIKSSGVTYPVMRVVDLYFWQKGYEEHQKPKSRSASA